MTRFQNKSRALDLRALIPISLNSSNDGRLAPPPLQNCIGNKSPMATRINTTLCTGVLLVPSRDAQKKRSTRFVPSEQKKQEETDQRPRPPVLARQGMFLFLRRPENLSAEEQETLAQLRLLHPEVDQAYALVQQFAHMCVLVQENSLMIGSAV